MASKSRGARGIRHTPTYAAALRAARVDTANDAELMALSVFELNSRRPGYPLKR